MRGMTGFHERRASMVAEFVDTATPPTPGWESDAACSSAREGPGNVDWFASGQRAKTAARAAWQFRCSGCPVRVDCVESEVTGFSSRDDQVGIRGGLTAHDRELIRAGRQAKACAS